MEITAAMVKELRDKTGIGMMICKQALQETNGDMTIAIENLRKQGQMTAAKRAGKAAKEGLISIVSSSTCAITYEVNTETDFVSRNDDFIAFVDTLGKILLDKKPADISGARCVVLPSGITADAHVTELIGKIGENISFRRYRKFDINPACERVATYVHGKGKIGVMVKLSIDKPETVGSEAVGLLGKDIAMQIAAANPIAANRDSIPAATIAKEKEIYFTQAQTSGKPDKIWDKIVEGKMVKFFQETVLTEQAFIRDTAMTVTDRIKVTEKETGAKIGVIGFTRLELGTDDEAAA